jgi:hypothetical protein
MRLLKTDVLGSLDDYYDGRCNSNVSLSDKLYFPPKHVRYSFIRSVFKLTVVCHHCSTSDSENVKRRSHLVSNSKHSSVLHPLSKQLEVTVHTAYEEHPVSHETQGDAYSGSDGQSTDKPDEVSVGGGLRLGGENSSGLDERIGG